MKNFFKIFKNKVKDIPDKKEYKIRESIHGNFFYHISLDKEVLCGKEITLVTLIPISAWGIVSHLGEKYCKECEKIFNEEKNEKD